jgi:transposase
VRRAWRASGRDDYSGVLRLYAKRNTDLGRARNRTACRLHALLAELVPGGISKEINAKSAARLLAAVDPVSPVERARHGLALEHLEDLRRFDEQMRASKRRIAAAVTESATTVTDLFGVGPVVAAMVIGYTGDVRRFANRDHYAAYTGTSPIEMSSGGRIVHRLSRRGNRQLNHAIHIAAITQIRFAHSPGRAFLDRKIAEGKTKREAVRAPQASDQRRHLPTAAPRHRDHGPGRANGDGSGIQRDRPRTPTAGASEEPLPDPTKR